MSIFAQSPMAALGLGLAALAYTSPAAAHDPPFVKEILWETDTDASIKIWTNRGLIQGTPQAGFKLLCTQALNVTSTEAVHWAETSTDELLLATSSGLFRTADLGCSLTPVEPFGMKSIYALEENPQRPGSLWLATGGESPRGIYVSEDEGATFTELYAIGDTKFFMELMAAPSGGDVLYARILESGQTGGNYLGASTDGGASWIQLSVPLVETELEFNLMAVHPADPQQLVIKAVANTAGNADRVLLTIDGGMTFQPLLEVLELKHVGFSADGAQLLVSGRDGLWISSDSGQTFTQHPMAERMTLTQPHDGALYVAGMYAGIPAGVDGIARSTDGGQTFEPVMSFSDVTEPMACPADSQATQACARLWLDWMTEFGVPATGPEPAGMPPAAGTDATPSGDGTATPGSAGMVPGVTPAPSPTPGPSATGGMAVTPPTTAPPPSTPTSSSGDSGGCHVSSRSGPGWSWTCTLGAALTLLWRRRRRQR